MARLREERQDAIREIVRNGGVHTQRELAEELQELGFNCTQATVSRDISEIGLCKLSDGVYILAEDLRLQRMVSEFVVSVEAAVNLVVVKTQPGTAPGVAAAIDAADIPMVKGTIAGDDTLIVIAGSVEDALGIATLIDEMCLPHKATVA